MRLLSILLIFAAPCVSRAQSNDTAILYDVWKGNLPNATELILQHHPHSDEGNYVLIEQKHNGTEQKTKGQWTVLRGGANNKNATVVELDKATSIKYLLRTKNGDLELLDNNRQRTKPAINTILKKEKYPYTDNSKNFKDMPPLRSY